MCCGAKIISSFSTFKKKPESWEDLKVFKRNRKDSYEKTEEILKKTDYFAIYVAILSDSQLYINELLLLKHGFKRVARGLNPIHGGSNNTLYVKIRDKGWGKEVKQDDLHSFNPLHNPDESIPSRVEAELNALVAEWEDAGDLKPPAKKLVGSSPTKGTKIERDEQGGFKKKEVQNKPTPTGREWREGDVLRAIDGYAGRLIKGQEYIVRDNDLNGGYVYVHNVNQAAYYHRFEFVRKGPNWN